MCGVLCGQWQLSLYKVTKYACTSWGSTGMFGNLVAIHYIMLQFIQNHSSFVMLMKTCMISSKASTFNALETLCENVYQCGYPNLLIVTQIYIILMIRAVVKYVFVFANINTNMAYLHLYLIKSQTMYLYLILTNTSSNTLYSWAVFQTQFYGTQTYMNIPYKHVKECYSFSK